MDKSGEWLLSLWIFSTSIEPNRISQVDRNDTVALISFMKTMKSTLNVDEWKSWNDSEEWYLGLNCWSSLIDFAAIVAIRWRILFPSIDQSQIGAENSQSSFQKETAWLYIR